MWPGKQPKTNFVGFWREEKGESQLTGEAIGAIVMAAVAVVVVAVLFGGGRALAAIKAHYFAANTVEGLYERMTDECSPTGSVLSCRVPPTDVFGNSNADAHEVAMFTRTTCNCGPLGKGEDLFWAYYWDKNTNTVTLYKWQWNGTAFTAAQAQPGQWTNVTQWQFANVLASTKADPTSQYYNPVVAAIPGLTDRTCSYGFTDFPGWNGTVEFTIGAGKNGADGTYTGSLGVPNMYCALGRTYITGYFTPTPTPSPTPTPTPAATPTPTPTPAATSGPLRTLAQVEFSDTSLAYNDNGMRLAMWLNKLLGGGVASASTGCTYAQLWMYDASGNAVLDTNGGDGFNETDSNGCLSSAPVKLWASESNYSGTFFDTNPNCRTYASIAAANWGFGSYTTVTPVASTTGCIFPVYSADRTPANGGSKNVNIIVDQPAPSLIASGASTVGGTVPCSKDKAGEWKCMALKRSLTYSFSVSVPPVNAARQLDLRFSQSPTSVTCCYTYSVYGKLTGPSGATIAYVSTNGNPSDFTNADFYYYGLGLTAGTYTIDYTVEIFRYIDGGESLGMSTDTAVKVYQCTSC